MHIVFIGFVWPEPNSSAAGQNIFSYITACLEANWKVSFLSAADQNQYSANLSELGVSSYVTKLNCSSFNSQIIQLQPDIVIFDRFLTFEQFAWRVKEACPSSLLVIDAEDLHFLRKARQLFVKANMKNNKEKNEDFSDVFDEQENLIRPDFLYNDISFREMSCILKADLTITLSFFEKKILSKLFGMHPNQLAHLPFILSNPTYHDPLCFDEKKDYVFIGNFRHAPNLHAVKLLANNIWPQIRGRLKSVLGETAKQIKCNVYGAYMTPEAKQLHSPKNRFLMHGHAESQFEVINSARVMLAPITFGAGVKGKLIDAFRVNTPSVTTTIGSEGITQLPFGGVISKNLEQFIESAVQLYIDKDFHSDLVANGQRILTTDYDVIYNKQRFIEALTNAKTNQAENRQQNFMQQLLNQQQFMANKYMSQWIEAKNKLPNS